MCWNSFLDVVSAGRHRGETKKSRSYLNPWIVFFRLNLALITQFTASKEWKIRPRFKRVCNNENAALFDSVHAWTSVFFGWNQLLSYSVFNLFSFIQHVVVLCSNFHNLALFTHLVWIPWNLCVICIHLKLWIASARHSFKWVKSAFDLSAAWNCGLWYD